MFNSQSSFKDFNFKKLIFKSNFLLLVLILSAPFILASESTYEIDEFTLSPNAEKTLNIYFENHGFLRNGNINFIFSNGICKESSRYSVIFKWGGWIPNEIVIPCSDNDKSLIKKYYTGFEGGATPLEIHFKSHDKKITGAKLKIVYGDEGQKIK